ncbi:MAG: signal recognition particle-docking protein FtsY [Treponema sp.]|jgi:fused signal recognition particle receptor|nr:signal recognition particle-docking protein FtsY [Treponema sp.]
MAPGFAGRIKNFFNRFQAVSEALFEELTDLLVEGDFGAAEAYGLTEKLRDLCKKEKSAGSAQVRELLARLLEETLRVPLLPEPELEAKGLAVILLLGVNGVGKTTTAAKLAKQYRDEYGRKPLLAAADTFRAAAIDQLKIHGQRLGIRVVAHQPGGDPAAVVYDALEAAQAGGGDLVIADTAGRMHTKTSLVEELKKIDRVVENRAAAAPCLKWLVLDATTGRNALAQAEIFHEAVSLNGAILTKYDSTARGGVVFSLASELKLPVRYLCEGEQYGDIRAFDPHAYAAEFAGLV